MKKRKLLFFVTEDWYFCSHRLPLAIAAKNAGFDVIVVTQVDSHGEEIVAAGIKLIPLALSRSGINPFVELRIIARLVSIYKSERPDIVHHVALKPMLYGSIVAWLTRMPHIVNALTGLGFLFSSKTLKARIVRPFVMLLFRVLLNRKISCVILQNPDDIKLMCKRHILKSSRIVLIRGSGVDTQKFQFKPDPSGVVIVVLASRLLWDKGVGEFVQAARELRQRGVKARFILVGERDQQNPSAIPHDQLLSWEAEGVVELWGQQENMPEIFAKSHIVCLPSYREGVPKVLIEAAACSKPIVTTDVPGCREIVHEGLNGFLTPIRDAKAVAGALKKLIESADLRKQMGAKGRELVEKDFTQEKVNAATLDVYQELFQ